MRISILLLLAATCLFLPAGHSARETGIRIIGLEPTPLFPRAEPLRQVAKLSLGNSGAATECGVEVAVEGESPVTARLKVPPGGVVSQVLVPDIRVERELRLTLRCQGGEVVEHRQQWQPQRHWKVTIVKSSHEDLGYEDYIYRKQHNIANNIELGEFLSAPRENVAESERDLDSQFHYTMESMLFQRNYIEERSEAAWRRLVEKQVKPGNMHLMGAPSGVHSHWMDYEELARMTYPGRREAKDRFGLDLKTFMIVDNPSLSWAGCQAVAEAGFRYVARWGQGWRSGGNNNYERTKVPAFFWWEAPDGRSRVLFGWRSHYAMSFWYGQTAGGHREALIDLGAENVTTELQRVESGNLLGPYPWDVLVVPDYVDHDTPRFDGRILPEWNRRFRYPEIRIGSPTTVFEYIEKNYGDRLETLRGDLNNFSADYSTIDPESQGQKRRAARLLPWAEGIGALAWLGDTGFRHPWGLIERTFTRLMDYDEHSWPTLPRASDVQLFNATWVKKKEAERALAGAERAVELSETALLRQIPVPEANSLVVFNPLVQERSDLVEVEGDFTEAIDPANGETLPVQRLADRRQVLLAKGIPSYGYKVLPTRRGGGTKSGASVGSSLEAGPTWMANEFYRIEFDAATGTIRSIVDRELQRELVDQSARHRFNQLVYIRKTERESKEGTEYSPTGARLRPGQPGPVAVEFTVEIDDAVTGAAIVQRVTLYRGLKQIDIVNDLAHVKALHSDNYVDRYRDNLYFAFPVKVDDFEARAEYPGGVVRPWKDQLRWGTHDYLSANRWVDVSNGSFGVTMALGEAQNVNFGEIRYNQFSIDYRPATSHLYSYAYSNRMAGLLTLNGDDPRARLSYRFTSHQGDWQQEAPRLGWGKASPLRARLVAVPQPGVLPAGGASFVRVKAENVALTTLKLSEQPGRGLILRLVETAGRETETEVELPNFPVARAFSCDLVENDRGALEVAGRTIRVKLARFGFATVRVMAEETEPLPKASGLRGAAVSDSKVTLSWQGSGSGWNVYRSEDPDAPPTAWTLVARTVPSRFADEGLKIDTSYFYRVAPVTRYNRQGEVSPPITVRTKRTNLTPPAEVEDLGVVRRAPDRLIVYWRRNQEPDVARYLVYRGERPDFVPTEPIATLRPTSYFLQTWDDRNLKPGTTYYYQVFAEDWAGHRQRRSPVGGAQTPGY